MNLTALTSLAIILSFGQLEPPVESPPKSDVVLIENAFIAVEVERASGSLTVLEKQTGTRWEGDPWDGEVGELTLQHAQGRGTLTCGLSQAREILVEEGEGCSIRCTFRGFRNRSGQESPESTVQTSIRIEAHAAEVVVQVDHVIPGTGWQFRTLHYPLRQFAVRTYQDHGYLAVPLGRDGYLIPAHHFPYPAPNFWIREDYTRQLTVDCSSLSMPWFGAQKDKSAFIATLDQPTDASLQVVANTNRWGQAYRSGRAPSDPRILSGSIIWGASQGAFRYPRVLRYRFLPFGGYVEMAKAYRETARRQGKFLSLDQRVAQNPKVDRLIGAVLLGVYGGYPHHRHHPHMGLDYRELEDLVRDLKEELDVPNAVVNPWSILGEQSPAFLPLNQRQGTLEELRSAAEYTTGAGYLFVPYTYYSAYHQESAAWDPRLEFRDGAGLNSEVEKWFRICPTQFVRLAKSFVPEMMRMTSTDGVWVRAIAHLWDT